MVIVLNNKGAYDEFLFMCVLDAVENQLSVFFPNSHIELLATHEIPAPNRVRMEYVRLYRITGTHITYYVQVYRLIENEDD